MNDHLDPTSKQQGSNPDARSASQRRAAGPPASQGAAAGRTPAEFAWSAIARGGGLPAAIVLCFVALSATSLQRNSATFDESHYLGVGLPILSGRPGEVADQRLHPPLVYVWSALPLLWLIDVPEALWTLPSGDQRGQRLMALRGDDWVLDSSRMAMLPIGAALCLVVFRWAQRLYGDAGGVLALVLCAFSPNLIAHARLITPDVTLAFFTVLSLYLLWRLADEPGWRRLSGVGACLGLMLLSKYTALVLVPILVLTDLAYRAHSGRWRLRRSRDLLAPLRHWIPLGAIALGITWAAYGFDTGTIEVAPGLRIPALARPYIEGALFQWGESRLPHDFFLMGDYSNDGWWYFYLVVLLIKVPLGTTALVVAAALGRRWRAGAKLDAREIWLWLPALAFFVYLSLFNTIHNGIRYLLPVGPLVLVAAGRLATVRRPVARVAVAALAAWVVGASIRIWPDYIAYHNELIGGPRNAYRWTSDSNLDWGQDLEQLKAWMVSRGVPRVQLAYFGSADPAHYGIDYDYLPSPNSWLPHTPPAHTRARIVALSVYQYQMVGFAERNIYAAFHELEPNDRVGYSILIFDLDRPIPRRRTTKAGHLLSPATPSSEQRRR